MAALRVLAAEHRFTTCLGVHPDFPDGVESCPLLRLPATPAEHGGPAAWLPTRRVALAVREWLAADSSRIFHGHSRAGLLVALWLDLMGVRRVVSTVHTLGRHRWLYRLAARRLGSRLFWLGPAMKRHYGIAPADWSNCLPDAVPRATVRPAVAARRGRGITFGAVGALVPVKQWETLLRAAASLDRSRDWRFVHAGAEDGSAAGRRCAADLRALHRQLGLESRWEFRGHVDDIAGFLGEIDCLVVSSPWEASSMAALEAIAAGVPVLVPARSGTSDIINAAGGGWLFDGEAELVRSLEALTTGGLRESWRRDDAGLERFMADRVAAQHAEFYREILA